MGRAQAYLSALNIHIAPASRLMVLRELMTIGMAIAPYGLLEAVMACAVMERDIDIVEQLLALPSPPKVDECFVNLLAVAVGAPYSMEGLEVPPWVVAQVQPDMALVRLLLDHGADPSRNSYMALKAHGMSDMRLPALECMLPHCLDKTAAVQAALMCAAANGQVETCAFLLPTVVSTCTAEYYADACRMVASYGHTSVLEMMLDRVVDVDEMIVRTCLGSARDCNQGECVAMLQGRVFIM